MLGPARATFALLWLGLAAAGAVACHRAAEAMHGPYDGYAHTAVVPIAVLAAVLLALVTLAAAAERAERGTGPRDWLVRGAADALATPSRRSIGVVLLLQLGLTFAMEQGERVVATGRPFMDVGWLGAAPLLALALQALVAVLAVVGLRALLRHAVDACDALLRFAAAALDAIQLRGDARPTVARRRRATLARRGPAAARHRALRAPPTILRSAT